MSFILQGNHGKKRNRNVSSPDYSELEKKNKYKAQIDRKIYEDLSCV